MLYPVDFPARAVANERLVLNRRQSATESPFTYAVQVVQTASQWMLQWSWPRMGVASAEAVRAFLISLKGQVGTFRYYPAQLQAPSLPGRSLAQAAGAYGEAMLVGGWQAGDASNLRAGQYLQIGAQLLTVLDASETADGSGHVTISFAPELRKPFAAGEPVIFDDPCGVFRLATSDGQGYTLDPDLLPDLGTIQAREVI